MLWRLDLSDCFQYSLETSQQYSLETFEATYGREEVLEISSSFAWNGLRHPGKRSMDPGQNILDIFQPGNLKRYNLDGICRGFKHHSLLS